VLTAVIGGTVTAADVLTVTVFDRGISSGSRAVSYTVQAGDSLDTIASSLAAAINAENALSNEGISASSVGPVLNILSRSRNLTTASQSVSPGATETIAMSPAANVTGYGYNNVNELTSISPGGNAYFQGTTNKAVKSVTVGSVPATLDSTRDFSASAPLSQGANDVPVTAIDGGNNSKTENFQIPIRGQQSAALTFDANGNMTSNGTGQTYEWDAENRLIKINYPGMNNYTTFTFDGLGRCTAIAEVSAGSITSTKQHIWCSDRRCEERDGAGTLVRRFFERGQTISGTGYMYCLDHLASTTEMTDSSGIAQTSYRYESFGGSSRVLGTLESDMQYAGYYFHERSGMSLSRTRSYIAHLGRWQSRDPLEEIGSGPNLYSYVGNQPIVHTDPSGLLVGVVVVGVWVGSQMVFDATVAVTAGTLIGVGIGSQIGPGPFAAHKPGQPGPVSTDPAHPTPTTGTDPLEAQDTMKKGPVTPAGPRTPCGKCPPCPPNIYWSHPGNAHGSTGGVHYHGIRWNQNPVTCVCFPKRVSGPTPYNMH